MRDLPTSMQNDDELGTQFHLNLPHLLPAAVDMAFAGERKYDLIPHRREKMRCPHCHGTIHPFRNPVPTVDIIIEVDQKIVLIERKNAPLGWALPGGFVDYGESFEQAALREAMEETGLRVENLQQFHTYSEPGRDPRCHTVSTVFTGKAKGTPRAGDDAGQAMLFGHDCLPGLAFDHERILRDYFSSKTKKEATQAKDNS
ncbi:unnamed protein product [Cyprideis torosa]|uniref:Uncharacterized protein n=1 Tax=Cyprideis torosa TaxID=163714 RepID=A0A7R8WQI9_9CRUS|nr:unnamed protein product [Cyprideis torosa]CAG0906726.1 unnamed protein product [Cyprideis torosa]